MSLENLLILDPLSGKDHKINTYSCCLFAKPTAWKTSWIWARIICQSGATCLACELLFQWARVVKKKKDNYEGLS